MLIVTTKDILEVYNRRSVVETIIRATRRYKIPVSDKVVYTKAKSRNHRVTIKTFDIDMFEEILCKELPLESKAIDVKNKTLMLNRILEIKKHILKKAEAGSV